MNALLPEDMENHTIATMQIGETAYVVPWAMVADHDRRLWLNPRYTAHRGTGGTVCMKIRRESTGFHVWEAPGKRYTPDKIGFAEPLPVIRFTRRTSGSRSAHASEGRSEHEMPMTDAEAWERGLRVVVSTMTPKEWGAIRFRQLEHLWDRATYSKLRAYRTPR